jgi:stress response protein SCP2
MSTLVQYNSVPFEDSIYEINFTWEFENTKKKEEKLDIDCSCFIFGKSGNLIDIIFFNNLSYEDGAVVHYGDNKNKEIEQGIIENRETIEVDLFKINKGVVGLVFCINSFESRLKFLKNIQIEIFDKIKQKTSFFLKKNKK